MERKGTASRAPLVSIPPPMVGRCELFDEIASGGMATIHLGRMRGAGGFSRTVAVKRMHEQCSRDPEFVAMFLDEARIVARIRHPNVAATLDLVEEGGLLSIIMEYVEGISFSELLKLAEKKGERVPAPVAVRVVTEALHGLQAAHEATDEMGRPMGIVHRDVSPENIMVGTDGYPRVLDFGIARAAGRLSSTRDGSVKGKIAYMAPEQILGTPIDRRTDVFAASAILWQALTGKRLWMAENFVELAHKVLNARIEPPSKVLAEAPKKYDAIVMRGLEREVEKRWRSAGAMAEALEAVGGMATHREVGLWVKRLGVERLQELAAKVSKVENKRTAARSPATESGCGRPGAGAAPAERAQSAVGPSSPTDTGINRVRRPPPPPRTKRNSDTFEVGTAEPAPKKPEDETAGTLAVVSAEPEAAPPAEPGGRAASAGQRGRWLVVGASMVAIVAVVGVLLASREGGDAPSGVSSAEPATSTTVAEPTAATATQVTEGAGVTSVPSASTAATSSATTSTASAPSAVTATPKPHLNAWPPPTKPPGTSKPASSSLYGME